VGDLTWPAPDTVVSLNADAAERIQAIARQQEVEVVAEAARM
jgi:hypothetical protein